MEGLLSTGPTPSSLIVVSHCENYIFVELRKDCKFSKLFMYLKRAPASSGCALLRCGMSWGPSAAGGSPTSAALSLFSKLKVK